MGIANRFVSHLESALDQTRLDPGEVHTLHHDRPLWVRYDLDRIGTVLAKKQLEGRPGTMWRYRELLPLPFDVQPVSLGEGMSPLIPAPALAGQFGLRELLVKDESSLPTGSFKSRGLGMAVTMAKWLGLSELAIPTAGNAGGALAAYAARAGMRAHVFMPQDTPVANQYECLHAGADVHLVEGLINDCGRIVRAGCEQLGWFDLSTLKEPYRIEGKKTMGLELAEQCGWSLPDVILYPTGGGTGLIGMWKAFDELKRLSWLEDGPLPKMVAVQSNGCAPIVRAFEQGQRFAEPWAKAQTCATGIRVPAAVGDFMILDAIRESGGTAIAVDEELIEPMQRKAICAEGISFCPEAAACLLALPVLRENGTVAENDRVVVFNTGSALKYLPAAQPELPVISDPDKFDPSDLAQ